MSQKILVPLDLGGQRLTNIGAPTTSTDAATRSYVDSTSVGRYRGNWTSGTPADGLGAYVTSDIATYQGTTYRANSTPDAGVSPANNLDWDIIAQGGADGVNGTNGVSFTYQGEWISGTPYLIGQWVTYSGDLYYCNGNIANATAAPNIDVGWNLGMEGGGGGGVSPGQVPLASIRASGYLFTQCAGSQGNSTAVGVGVQVASPLYIPDDTTADRFCLQIITLAASALWRLGIYADTGAPTHYPGALVYEAGTVDGSTSGVKEITPGTPPDLPAGVYWICGKVEGAYAAARGTSGPVWGVVPSGNSSSNDVAAGYICTGSGSSLLSTWPSWGTSGTGTVGAAPRVGIRVTG